MKKVRIDRVDLYRFKKNRIACLNRMACSKKVDHYFVSAWEVGDAEIDTEEFSQRDETKRLRAFLKEEIKIEEKILAKLGQKIVRFGP